MPSAIICYFSGTGNTFRAAHMIGDLLKDVGYEVQIRSIEQVPITGPFDLEIFAFPVYSFAPPAAMIRYLKALPKTNSRAAVLAVHGALKYAPGYQGGATAQVSGILKRKGREVFLTAAVGYPASITQLLNPPEIDDQRRIAENADRMVQEVGRKIALGQRSIQNCNPLIQVLLWPVAFLFSTIAHRLMGKLYVADDRCNSCGLCIRACPVKAVKLRNGRPYWSWCCEACQRCINLCPQRAIQTSDLRALGIIGLMFPPLDSWLGLDTPYVPSGILLRFLAYLAAVYLLDLALTSLERRTWLSRITRFSFTRGFRRYLAPGFDPPNDCSAEAEKGV